MSVPGDPSNPYLSPAPSAYGVSPTAPPLPRAASGLPGYCLVMFIIDLFFSLVRAPLVAMSIAGLYLAGQGFADDTMGRMVAQTGLAEVLTGAAIVLFGVPGAIGLLCKQRWGLALGWAAVAATLGSIGVGFWQLSFMIEQFPDGSPERVGAIIGGVFTGVFRVALLGAYAAALVVFANWSAKRGERGR